MLKTNATHQHGDALSQKNDKSYSNGKISDNFSKQEEGEALPLGLLLS